MLFGDDLAAKVPYGYCHCGCGQRTRVAQQTSKRDGWVRGEPVRYVSGHHQRGRRKVTAPDSCRIEGDIARIPLRAGGEIAGWAQVDLADLPEVLARRWRLLGGYAVAGGGSDRVSMHRLLMEPGDALVVDHVNGDGLDNRRSNLRIVSQAINQQNRRGAARGSTSRYRGVFWDKARQKWVARVQVDGRQFHGGVFEDEQRAGEAAACLRARLMPGSAEARR